MVIRKMNTVLVKHNKILFGAFSLIIIVSFVWFFTPGMDGSMFFGSKTSPSSAVGKVFGNKVTLKDYQRAIEAKSILLSLYTPASPAELREYAAANIFVDIAMDAAAEKAGVAVSDDEVIAEIKRIPFFSPDGKFDHKRYETFIKMNVEPIGLTSADFEDFVRKSLAARKVLGDIAVNVIFVPSEFNQFQNFNMEKVKAATITFPFASYKPTGKITEQELQDFYKTNAKFFMTAPQIKADIVAFDYKDYLKKTAVTEKDIQNYYNQYQDQFKKDGKVLPLAQVKAKVLAAVKQAKAKELAMDAAKTFRDELYDATAEISTGAGQIEAFRKLAGRKNFRIIATPWVTANADKLGTLGSEPALLAALFRTTDRYPITRSVEGANAAYVALAALRQPSVEAPFAEVKAQVQERLIQAKSINNAKEAASDFAAKLSASKNPVAELAASSKNPAIKIKQLPLLSRQSPSTDPIARYVLEMPGNVSPALELSDGMVVVLVEKRTPPTEAEKLAAKEQLTQDYLAEKRALASVAFQNWVLSNVESYLEREQNAPR